MEKVWESQGGHGWVPAEHPCGHGKSARLNQSMPEAARGPPTTPTALPSGGCGPEPSWPPSHCGFWLTVSGREKEAGVRTGSMSFQGKQEGRQVMRQVPSSPRRDPAAPRPRWGRNGWWGVRLPPPQPLAHSPTLFFFDVPPASHPAVGPVLELRGGGQNTDGLDVLIVGDGGGQLQQGDVIGRSAQIQRARNDLLHTVPVVVGLQVPDRR